MPMPPYNGPQYQYVGPNAYGPYPTVPMQPTFPAPQTQTQPQPPIQTTTLPGRVIKPNETVTPQEVPMDGTASVFPVGYDQLAQMNAINANIANSGYQVQTAINGLSSQLANCCCETREAIQGVNYNLATGQCAITAAIANAARDIADNQNANYRALHDEIVANRMEDKNAQIAQLQSQVQALNLAQSQANQNSYLLQQLRPCPIPAYTVPNPCAAPCYSTYQSCGC